MPDVDLDLKDHQSLLLAIHLFSVYHVIHIFKIIANNSKENYLLGLGSHFLIKGVINMVLFG